MGHTIHTLTAAHRLSEEACRLIEKIDPVVRYSGIYRDNLTKARENLYQCMEELEERLSKRGYCREKDFNGKHEFGTDEANCGFCGATR